MKFLNSSAGSAEFPLDRISLRKDRPVSTEKEGHHEMTYPAK
jgi:hypothetical protein